MKVALVTKLYPPSIGGIQRHVQLLAKKLREVDKSIEVQVIVAQDRPSQFRQQVEENVLVQRATTIAYIASNSITVGLSKLLKRADADLYHFHSPYPWSELAALRANLRAPIVATYHMDVVRQKKLLTLYRPFLHKFLERTDRIIASSPNLVATSPFLRRYREKVVVIPLGIDTSCFIPTNSSCAKAAELRHLLAGNKPTILFVGRFVYYKGLEYLIQAMKYINGILILVGDGPLQSSLRALANQVGVEHRIKFVGLVSDQDLPIYYQTSDIFVLPSIANTEAYGLVQLEAHASGIPTVSTNLSTGVAFVNQHHQTGLVVPPGNVQSLVGALRHLLEDTALRARFGKQAQQRAIEQFDINSCTQATVNLYYDVLSARGSAS